MENFFRRHKPAASPSAWQNVDTVAPGICRLPTKGLFGSYSYFLSRFHMGSSVTKDLRTSLTVPYCRRCVYFCIVVAGGYAIFNLIADLTTSTPPTSYFDCGPSTPFFCGAYHRMWRLIFAATTIFLQIIAPPLFRVLGD
ncbi:hypothetical protein V1521DRAFT_424285 [Lipomyces starkeyi]